MMEPTDLLNSRGDVLKDLAWILRRAGDDVQAALILRDAVELYERKGNVVAAGWARDLLQELSVPNA
jgi:hypothetical protein